MKEFVRKCWAATFDLRLIVALCGIVLSVVMHELFHIIVHWGEIREINLLPDSHAIVEVIFVPAMAYDLAVEEAIAYGITMITLILTAMLVGDIHDARDERTAGQTVIAQSLGNDYSDADEQQLHEHLSILLGISPIAKS